MENLAQIFLQATETRQVIETMKLILYLNDINLIRDWEHGVFHSVFPRFQKV